MNNNVEEEEEAPHSAEELRWEADLHWLTPHLAVGAAFPMHAAPHLASAHGIGAVVDLRSEGCDDEGALRDAGIAFLHLPTQDLHPATIDKLDRGVEFARAQIDDGRKVLIHCQHGIGRSALLALCVLVDLGWEPLDALAHAKDRRAAVSPSFDQYCGWARWLELRGKPVPDYHTFGCIAYRHLASD